MILTFHPQLRSDALDIIRDGDVLTINGTPLDFSSVPNGGEGFDPAWTWIVGPVRRIAGVLHVHILLPVASEASAAMRFPEPLTLTGNGPVALPE